METRSLIASMCNIMREIVIEIIVHVILRARSEAKVLDGSMNGEPPVWRPLGPIQGWTQQNERVSDSR